MASLFRSLYGMPGLAPRTDVFYMEDPRKNSSVRQQYFHHTYKENFNSSWSLTNLQDNDSEKNDEKDQPLTFTALSDEDLYSQSSDNKGDFPVTFW